MKLIKISDLREIDNQIRKGEITSSRGAEILNERIVKRLSDENRLAFTDLELQIINMALDSEYQKYGENNGRFKTFPTKGIPFQISRMKVRIDKYLNFQFGDRIGSRR